MKIIYKSNPRLSNLKIRTFIGGIEVQVKLRLDIYIWIIIYKENGGLPLETVELRFQYTQSEFIRAERQYLISSKTIHKYDIALVAIFLFLSGFYMLYSSFSIVKFKHHEYIQ